MMDVIKDHKLDVDYENPRDFIDVYLTHMRENADSSFNDEQLVVVCLDLIEAGMIANNPRSNMAVLMTIMMRLPWLEGRRNLVPLPRAGFVPSRSARRNRLSTLATDWLGR